MCARRGCSRSADARRPGRSGGPCRARSAGPTAPAPSAAATGRAPRRPPATWPRCRGTDSRRRARRRPGSPVSAASFKRDLAVREARADASAPCRRPRRRSGGSVTPPGTRTHGRSCMRGQGHHHRRQSLVAGGDADDALPRRQRADQPAQHDGGVVAIGQAVHHAGRALRAAVAGIGAEAGERDAAAAPQFLRGGLHQQADFPVAGVIARGRRACRRGCECRRRC